MGDFLCFFLNLLNCSVKLPHFISSKSISSSLIPLPSISSSLLTTLLGSSKLASSLSKPASLPSGLTTGGGIYALNWSYLAIILATSGGGYICPNVSTKLVLIIGGLWRLRNRL